MEPSSPPIYRNLHSLDRFRKHVEENLVPGTLAQRPSGHGAPVRYIPTPTQSKYWTQAHVREVILATRDLDLLIEDICTNYFQVFSILVWISTTGCSYIRYMEKFIQYRVDNTSLPLQDVPKFLTSAIDDQNFYRIFSEHQFMFCPVDLTAGTMRNRILDPSLILPLKVERDLSTPTVGRPATVRLATLDQASVPKLSGSVRSLDVSKSIVQTDARRPSTNAKRFIVLRSSRPQVIPFQSKNSLRQRAEGVHSFCQREQFRKHPKMPRKLPNATIGP